MADEQISNETSVSLFDKVTYSLKNNYNIIKDIKTWHQVVGMLILSLEKAVSGWIIWSNLKSIVLGVM